MNVFGPVVLDASLDFIGALFLLGLLRKILAHVFFQLHVQIVYHIIPLVRNILKACNLYWKSVFVRDYHSHLRMLS